MQKGFVKAIFAIVIFAIGVASLFTVIAYTFGWIRIESDPEGDRYAYMKLNGATLTCWIDLPERSIERCVIIDY